MVLVGADFDGLGCRDDGSHENGCFGGPGFGFD